MSSLRSDGDGRLDVSSLAGLPWRAGATASPSLRPLVRSVEGCLLGCACGSFRWCLGWSRASVAARWIEGETRRGWLAPLHDEGRLRSADELLEPGRLRSLECAREEDWDASADLACETGRATSADLALEVGRETSADLARAFAYGADPLDPRSTEPAREAAVDELATEGALELLLDVSRALSRGGHHLSAEADRELARELVPPAPTGARGLPSLCACTRPAAARR